MKKIIYVILALSLFSCISCSMDKVDDINSIPAVDTSKYTKNPTEFKFPIGTEALDIYTVLYNKFGDNEVAVNGTYKTSYTYKFDDEAPVTVPKTYNIVKIKLYRKHNEASNEFHVYMVTDSYYVERVKDSNGNYIYKKTDKLITFDYCYQWQLHNTNVWNNNKCNGEIIIKNQ